MTEYTIVIEDDAEPDAVAEAIMEQISEIADDTSKPQDWSLEIYEELRSSCTVRAQAIAEDMAGK